jgi:hypothetical protein
MTDAAIDQGRNRVPLYARIEVIGGATMIALAGLIWFGSINLTLGTLPNFGPGALPRMLAILLGLAGLGMVARGVVQPEADSERFALAIRPTLIILLAIALFGIFIRGGDFGLLSTPQLGLCIVGPLTVFISGCAAPHVNARKLLVLAFGLTAMILLVFPDLLRLSIPPFPAGVHNAIAATLGPQTGLRVACTSYALIAAALHFAPVIRRKEAA